METERAFRGWVLAAAGVLAVGGLSGCGDDASLPAPDEPTSDVARPLEPPADASAEQASVQADVEKLAVSLETFYRGSPYPEDLAAVIPTLADAGLSLSPGNRLGSYVYDPDAVEFALCVESRSGAWATYDTAPMSVRDAGDSGGCP